MQSYVASLEHLIPIPSRPQDLPSASNDCTYILRICMNTLVNNIQLRALSMAWNTQQDVTTVLIIPCTYQSYKGILMISMQMRRET
jgi:hypothetical protein